MANEFKYTIRADDRSRQAVDSAQRNMGRAEQSAKKLGNAFKAAFTVGAIIGVGRTIAKVHKELIDAYAKQEAAERKLAAAVRNNPLLDDSSRESLQGFASDLQKITTMGDETTIELMSMAAAWGRNEEEIKAMATSAADLSAGLGMDLQTAMRGLNNVMEGNVQTLSRYIPALRDLTAEQIESGEAMDIINDQFGGMAAAMKDTTEGAMKSFNNAWGDLKEVLGQGLAPLFTSTLQFMTDLISKTTEFVGKIFELKSAFNALDLVVNPAATSMANLVNQGLDVSTYERALTAQAARIEEVQRQLSIKMDLRRQATARGAANTSVYDQQIQDILNMLAQEENLLAQIERARQAAEAAIPRTPTVTPPSTPPSTAGGGGSSGPTLTPGEQKAAFLAGLFDDLGKSVTGVRKIYVEQESELSALDLQFGNLNIGTNKLYDTIVETGEPLRALGDGSYRVADAFKEAAEAGESFTEGISGAAGSRYEPSFNLDGLTKAFAAGGPLLAGFQQLAQHFDSLVALMDPVNLLLTGIADALGPLVNDTFTAFVGMLLKMGETVGQMLMPALSTLMPFLDAWAKAWTFLYNNVFVPVYNALRTMWNAIYNGFAGFINGLIYLINLIPFVNINSIAYRDLSFGHLDKIEEGGLGAAGADYLGGGGGNANYTTGRNITVNIDIFSDVIAGEGGVRELAVMIRDEIRAAEALGY